MSAALFQLISTDPAKGTATYKVTGDFSLISRAMKALTGKPIYAMGGDQSVGRVAETIAGRDGAKVVVKITDGLTAKKVGAGVLAAGQCRLGADGSLGSFNLVDAPLDDDQLHKAAGLKQAAASTDPVAMVKAAIARAKAPVVRGLPGDATETVRKILADMEDIDGRLIRMGAERELEAGCGGVLLKSLPTSADQTIAALSDMVADLRMRLEKAESRPMPPKTAVTTTAEIAKVEAVQTGDEPTEVAAYDLWQFRGSALEKVATGLADVVADLRKRMIRAEVNPSRPSLRMAPGSRSISKVEDVSPGGSNEVERTVTAEEFQKYLATLAPEERARIELRAALSRPIQIGRSA